MSDGDDAPDEASNGEDAEPTPEEEPSETTEEEATTEESTEEADESPEEVLERLQSRLGEAEGELEAAETESDLDEVEADLDEIEEEIEAAELPEPEDEDAESPADELEDDLSDLRNALEDQRGPYAEDVVSEIESAKSEIEDTRWTETGEGQVVDAVESFVESANDILDADVSVDGRSEDEAVAALDETVEAVEAADLDADDDEEEIAALLDATDELQSGVDDSQAFLDLSVRDQLDYEGFYDVLGHYKDFPPEWSALKEHEQRGNVEMVLLALDTLGSEFMEERCMEMLARMNDSAALDAMLQRAQRRDKPSIKAIGKMGGGASDAVDTLLGYVDTDNDPALQKVTFRALGEIGDERATQPLANKLVMDDDNVRTVAARALGLLGDTRAIDPLTDTIRDDESDGVRASAVWALRQIGTKSALEAAAEFRDDRSYLVQTEARQADDALAGDHSDTPTNEQSA